MFSRAAHRQWYQMITTPTADNSRLYSLNKKHSSRMRTDRRSSLHSWGCPLDTLPLISYPLDTLPNTYPMEGTWYQRYPTPAPQKGHGTRDTPRKDLVPGIPYPSPTHGQNDRHLWKHYFPATSLAVGNEPIKHYGLHWKWKIYFANSSFYLMQTTVHLFGFILFSVLEKRHNLYIVFIFILRFDETENWVMSLQWNKETRLLERWCYINDRVWLDVRLRVFLSHPLPMDSFCH